MSRATRRVPEMTKMPHAVRPYNITTVELLGRLYNPCSIEQLFENDACFKGVTQANWAALLFNIRKGTELLEE
jgi:hypothetical protein